MLCNKNALEELEKGAYGLASASNQGAAKKIKFPTAKR